MKNKFTRTRQHNILTKGTANSILRLRKGPILLATAQLTVENLSFKIYQFFKCPVS